MEKGKSRQVHEVADEDGDSDMGMVDRCLIAAATDELFESYNDDPWAVAFAPPRTEAPVGKGTRWTETQESVRNIVRSCEPAQSIKTPP